MELLRSIKTYWELQYNLSKFVHIVIKLLSSDSSHPNPFKNMFFNVSKTMVIPTRPSMELMAPQFSRIDFAWMRNCNIWFYVCGGVCFRKAGGGSTWPNDRMTTDIDDWSKFAFSNLWNSEYADPENVSSKFFIFYHHPFSSTKWFTTPKHQFRISTRTLALTFSHY